MIGNGHAPAAQMDYLSFRGCALVTPSGSCRLPWISHFIGCSDAFFYPAGFCGVLPHFVELVVIDFSMCEQVRTPQYACVSQLHGPNSFQIQAAYDNPSSTSLRPPNLRQVDDSVISCLSRCCRRLSTLDVTACKLLTDTCAGELSPFFLWGRRCSPACWQDPSPAWAALLS
jgi:hypothetical protein